MSLMECYPKLRDRGQVTIPEEIRDTLGLEPGDRIIVNVQRMDE